MTVMTLYMYNDVIKYDISIIYQTYNAIIWGRIVIVFQFLGNELLFINLYYFNVYRLISIPMFY